MSTASVGRTPSNDDRAVALARLYDLDLTEDPGDVELYRALARRTGGPILELAVGSARIALALAEDGHDVVGVDLDQAMLGRAASRTGGRPRGAASRLRLVEGDLVAAASLPEVAGAAPYRLAFVALNSILLLSAAPRQRAAIETMARLVAPGGLVVVDAWQPTPADLVAFDGRLALEWLRTDPETAREVTKTVAAWYDPTSRLVTLTTLFDEAVAGRPVARWSRTDALRLISPDELVAFAEAAGLEVEHVAGGYGLEPLEPGSERAILVARRPGRT